jgi:leader peptidase (prepilin peptidase)/N-methyltransferase
MLGLAPNPLDWLIASAAYPWLALVLGLCVGSFLNVVIHRLPLMMEREWTAQCAELRGEVAPDHAPLNLSQPRSRCPACGQAISALQNIPLLSFLWLRGRCAACSTRISWRYPLVELFCGLATAYCALHFGFSFAAAAAMLFVWLMIAATGIDFDTQLLPDSITLPLLWLGLAFNLSGTFVPITEAVVGAMLGYGILWSIFWIFKLVTGKEGMGYGDFKLLAALGAWFGWKQIPSIILLASAVGATVGIVLIVSRQHRRETPIPFGPYLAGAGLLALYFGKSLGAFFGIA